MKCYVLGAILGFCIVILFRLMLLTATLNTHIASSNGPGPLLTEQSVAPVHTFEDLLGAIEWVESKGRANAIGDNGNAVGSFQIWKIYVDDVNRILGHDFYSYDDRFNRNKSLNMAAFYLTHYGGTFEEMAAKHVAGPDGHTQMDEPAVKKYVKKVMERMNNPQ